MTRVIAGEARGRRLAVPPGRTTRPTGDRAREGLFATLTAIRGTLAGAVMLDLYAGSGAVGIEALSRGASRVVFVEAEPRAARVIRENMGVVGLPGGAVIGDRVERVLARGPAPEAGTAPPPGAIPGYDLVFADPPYATADEEVAQMLTMLAERGWLAPEAVVAVERATRSGPVPWPPAYSPDRARRYGEATFWYGLAAGGRPV